MLHSFLGADSFVEEYMYFIVKNVESKLLLTQHRRHSLQRYNHINVNVCDVAKKYSNNHYYCLPILLIRILLVDLS